MVSDEERERSRLERMLATIERLLAIDAVELRPTLQRAAQEIAEVLGADKVDVFLYEPPKETLVALGTSDTPMGRRQHALGLDRLPLANGGRIVEVFQTGQSYLSGHVDRDPSELLGFRDALGVRSEMAVPLEVAGERRGVLAACAAVPDAFSEHDLLFLAAVARWVGMATHRAELTEQLTRQSREQGRREAVAESVARLTPREQEVATLIAFGLSNAEIAERLVITAGTVANHVVSILNKLGVSSRTRVAAIMAQLGIGTPKDEADQQ